MLARRLVAAVGTLNEDGSIHKVLHGPEARTSTEDVWLPDDQ